MTDTRTGVSMDIGIDEPDRRQIAESLSRLLAES